MSGRSRSGGLLVALACSSAIVAGCGTTVPGALTSGPGAGKGANPLEMGGSGAAPTTGTRAPGSAIGTATSAGSSASTPTVAARGGTGAQGNTVTPIRTGQSGRGYDAHHVYLGFNTINNLHTFSQAAGVKGLDFGNMKADAEGVIAEINANGGILGRKVVGVYHDEDVTQATTNPAANSQTTCTALTQDARVVAAVINDTVGDDNDNFYRCMAKADTPLFTSADQPEDRQRITPYHGYLYSMQSPVWDVFAPVFMNRLIALKYFSPWNTNAGSPGTLPAKLGLLFPDSIAGRRIAGDVARLAAAHGVRSYSYFYADPTTSGIAQTESSIGSSVVAFRGNGVTHLIPDSASITIFAEAAEQQQYRPRYGVQSLGQLSQANQNVPKGQFAGALGVGWKPTDDVAHIPDTAAARSCMQDVAREGQHYDASGQAVYVALVICDAVRLIAHALNAAGSISTTALAVGIGKAGPGLQTASTFRSGFSPSRPDIVGAVRDIGYDNGCSCFAYISLKLWPV